VVISQVLLHKVNGRLQTIMYWIELGEAEKAKTEIYHLVEYLKAHLETSQQAALRELNDI
jgi:hypothetical protein